MFSRLIVALSGLGNLRSQERGSAFNEYLFIGLLIVIILIIGAERIGIVVLDYFTGAKESF